MLKKSYNFQDVKKRRKGTIHALILVLVSQFFGNLWELYLNI